MVAPSTKATHMARDLRNTSSSSSLSAKYPLQLRTARPAEKRAHRAPAVRSNIASSSNVAPGNFSFIGPSIFPDEDSRMCFSNVHPFSGLTS